MKKKIAVIGGGTGMSYLLTGLKDFPVEITAITTVSDNGKSTGKLREEFSTPAVGDIRKVLTNLSTLPNEVKNVMEYRFDTYSDLNGHPIGNLLLTAMLNQNGSLLKSIKQLSVLLGVKHTVLPLSEDCLTLMAETTDGDKITGQEAIAKTTKKIKKLYYEQKPHVLKEVIEAINEADLIIISMGSLYTSIITHLICKEVTSAIKKSKASVMYVCNAMSEPGEMKACYVSDYIDTLEKYLGKNRIDVVVASNTEISKEMLSKYEKEAKDQVKIDYENLEKRNIEFIEDDLITLEDGTIKHNTYRLASIIFSYLMR